MKVGEYWNLTKEFLKKCKIASSGLEFFFVKRIGFLILQMQSAP